MHVLSRLHIAYSFICMFSLDYTLLTHLCDSLFLVEPPVSISCDDLLTMGGTLLFCSDWTKEGSDMLFLGH